MMCVRISPVVGEKVYVELLEVYMRGIQYELRDVDVHFPLSRASSYSGIPGHIKFDKEALVSAHPLPRFGFIGLGFRMGWRRAL